MITKDEFERQQKAIIRLIDLRKDINTLAESLSLEKKLELMDTLLICVKDVSGKVSGEIKKNIDRRNKDECKIEG